MTSPDHTHVRGALAAMLAVALAALVSAQSPNIALNDTFADGNRTSQSLPGSAAWYTSAVGSTLAVSSQALVFPGDPASAQHIVTYYTTAGAQSLGVGDTFTASFNFTPSGVANAVSGWRIALLDSGGSRVTADNLTTGNAAYNAWTGYALFVNPGGTSAQFYKRSGTGTTLLASTTAYAALGAPATGVPFAAGKTYTCIITITRTAAGVDLAASFSGGAIASYNVTVSDNATPFTTFDAFATAINRTGSTPAFSSLTMDNVYVGYAPMLGDRFDDGERAQLRLPASAQWVTSAPAAGLTVTSSQLVFAGDAAAPQHIVGYFAPAGRPVALAARQSLRARFTFSTPTAPASVQNGWRLGLFNSGGARVTTDGGGTSHLSYNGWTGYALMLNPNNTSGVAQLYKRAPALASPGGDALIAASGPYATTLGSSVPCQVFAANTTYTGQITLTRRTSGAVDIWMEFSGGALNGYTIRATDSSGAVTSFDALAMSINRSGSTPAFSSLRLDDVVVTAPPPPPDVLVNYDMLGNVAFGSTQGELGNSRAMKYRFTAMTTGRLYQITVNTQGARPNAEYLDTHSKGNYGLYRVRLYQVPAGDSVAGTDAFPDGPQGSMTLLGGTRGTWYPGRFVNGFQEPIDKWNPSNPSAPTNQTTGTGQHVVVGPLGENFNGDVRGQAFNSSFNGFVGALAGIDNDDDSTPPPANYWMGFQRAAGNGVIMVDVYDTAGNYGIAVTKGQVLCISQENQVTDYANNYARDNNAHTPYAPLPGYNFAGYPIPTPLDPKIGAFGSTGGRDWRKAPMFSVNIDHTWYGQPVALREGAASSTDDTGGPARLMYGSGSSARLSRQVITPRAGYDREITKVWVNAVRYTSKAGYTSTAGALQVRIRRAPVGTSSWTQIWPATGWASYPLDAFGVQATVPTGGASPHGSAAVPEADKAKIMKFPALDVSPSIRVTDGYHYAVELRADPAQTTAYYILASLSPYHAHHRNMPAVATEMNYPYLLPHGDSTAGVRYNVAEKSSDGGSTWVLLTNNRQIFPIALEPAPL